MPPGNNPIAVNKYYYYFIFIIIIRIADDSPQPTTDKLTPRDGV